MNPILFHSIKQRYEAVPATPHHNDIFYREYAMAGGTLELTDKLKDSELLSYLHGKISTETLLDMDIHIMVHHSMHYHFAHHKDIVQRIHSHVASDDLFWNSIMKVHYPDLASSSLSSLRIFEQKCREHVGKFLPPQEDVVYFQQLSDEEILSISPDAIYDVWRYLNGNYYAQKTLIPKLALHPHFDDALKKNKGVISLEDALLLKNKHKLKMESWDKALCSYTTNMLTQRPEYLTFFGLKGDVPLLTLYHWNKLEPLFESVEATILATWLNSYGKKLLLSPWIWLPDDLVPDYFQPHREYLKRISTYYKPESYYEAMGSIFQRLIPFLKEEKMKADVTAEYHFYCHDVSVINSLITDGRSHSSYSLDTLLYYLWSKNDESSRLKNVVFDINLISQPFGHLGLDIVQVPKVQQQEIDICI